MIGAAALLVFPVKRFTFGSATFFLSDGRISFSLQWAIHNRSQQQAMNKRWIPKPMPEHTEVASLMEQLNISKPLATILLQRGYADFEASRAFFRPELNDLHDPFLMKGMTDAVARIEAALENGEKILIYGDYDVDGTTSVALVYGFLRHFYDKLGYYIPDRYAEGYGISEQGIDYALSNGFSLVISLDCGIKAVELVQKAKDSGIDFIICDHHTPGKQLPNAIAILDPKQEDCPYPFKELSGCGIGFKLLQALCITQNFPFDALHENLDLVGISIACDIVPVIGENRVLLKYALEELNTAPRMGLRLLLQQAGLKLPLDVGNLVFGIGPRINAAGRIQHAHAAVKLLLSNEEKGASELAHHINAQNAERQNLDAAITGEALQMIVDNGLENKKTSVLYREGWHKGVIGIVASRCIETYYRPTIILTKSGEMATGSARSVSGFNIYEAIEQCAHLLHRFGGHKYAAGLTLPLENLAAFSEAFEAAVAASITGEQLIPVQQIDAILDLRQLTINFFKVLMQMAPYGPGNMRPVFLSKVEVVNGQYRLLKDLHLKMSVRQPGSRAIFPAIGFNMHHMLGKVSQGLPFYLCYNVELNRYNGQEQLQLHIRDIATEAEVEGLLPQHALAGLATDA